MDTEPDFNPALRDWLNARDYCSGDWPYNVPQPILQAADIYFGGGYILDENGYPSPVIRVDAQHAYDPLYLGA